MSALLDGIGMWCMPVSPEPFPDKRAAVFLDRDGVIVEETHYLGCAEDVRMIDGAAEAIARLNSLHIPVVLVTNQAGIARGYFDWHGFEAVQREIGLAIGAVGAQLDMVLACAYHDINGGPLSITDHPWRKPNPGMLLHAAAMMNLDLSRSVIVGDKISDLEAGRRAGLRCGTLVLTGHGRNERGALERENWTHFEISTQSSLSAAVKHLLSRWADLQSEGPICQP